MFVMLILLSVKTIMGIHWPWEKCDCCGKKWSEIRKERRENDDYEDRQRIVDGNDVR